MKITLAILALSFTLTANAATGCDEWATFTQVLVVRWQNDINFKDKSVDEVKKELQTQMGSHPEIKTALKWVDYAYIHKADDYLGIYKAAYNKCSTVEM